MRKRIHCALLACCAAALAAAEPAPASKASDDDLKIPGVFNSVLPKTERKHSLRLVVHPHLGDLTRKDHLRSALGFRYGITSHWEASAETDAYFTHGLRHGNFFDQSGFADLRLGTKYLLGDPLALGWETSVGLDWQRPMGQPPLDVTDGLRHLTPYLTTSHVLEDHPAWRVFTGLAYDDVTATNVLGKLDKNELGDDSLTLSGGVLFERAPFTYALEASYGTTRFTADVDRDVYALRPSVLWVLPKTLTFGSNSKWIFGFGLRFSHGPDGNDVGVNAKLRVNFDFKRLLGRKKEPASVP